MIIDWGNFTPWSALAGGSLIGLSAALLFRSYGMIAGISGLLGNLIAGERDRVGWRAMFLLGLIVSPGLWLLCTQQGLAPVGPVQSGPGDWAIVGVAGVLVGFGTRLANGCTSGHGVCGLARFSKRSGAAVLSFMASGAVTVFVTRHLIGG